MMNPTRFNMGSRRVLAPPPLSAWMVIAVVGLLGVFWPGPAAADPTKALEYELKAVFLQKLIQFVDWPDSAFADSSAAFVIGIMGDDPFGGALEAAFDGRVVSGHDVVIERHDTPDALTPSHLLFVSQSERGKLCEILDRVGDAPTLTVADFDGFCRRGGTLALSMSENRVKLAVNVEGCRRASLMISARLLRLATEVKATDCEAG